MSSSDSILERLVDLDQEACTVVENAEEVLESTMANMDREVASFKEDYAQRALYRIGIIKDEEGKVSQAAQGDITKRYDSLMAGLEQTYDEKHLVWEKAIFQRCIEK